MDWRVPERHLLPCHLAELCLSLASNLSKSNGIHNPSTCINLGLYTGKLINLNSNSSSVHRHSYVVPYRDINVFLFLLHSSPTARVTVSTTIFPTASENGGLIIEK